MEKETYIWDLSFEKGTGIKKPKTDGLLNFPLEGKMKILEILKEEDYLGRIYMKMRLCKSDEYIKQA